jgi:hypothetical protein
VTEPEPTVTLERIAGRILRLRGENVMLDADLAALYGVETKALNQAVKRNPDRFPADFMFRLTWDEAKGVVLLREVDFESRGSASRSQIVTLNRGANVKFLPHAFAEEGVAMLSSVLRSPRAAQVNVEIMRAFVRMRQVLASHADLAKKLDDLEQRYDRQFRAVFDAIRALMSEPERPSRPMGFRPDDEEAP